MPTLYHLSGSEGITSSEGGLGGFMEEGWLNLPLRAWQDWDGATGGGNLPISDNRF